MKSVASRFFTGLMFFAVLAAGSRCEAGDFVWSGPAGGVWSNGANWVGGVAPSNAGQLNTVEFGSSSSSVDDIPGLVVALLVFNGGGNVVKGSAGVTLTLDDGGFVGSAVIRNLAGANVVDKSLAVFFATNDYVNLTAGQLALNGNLTGYAPTLTGSGTGKLSLGGTNTFFGGFELRVDYGSIDVNSPSFDGALNVGAYLGTGFGPAGSVVLHELSSNNISNAQQVNVNSDAVFDLGGFSETIGNLEGYGAVHLGAGGALTLTAGFGGFEGVMSGAGSFTMTGGNYLYLDGDNTYTGPTTAAGGLLIVNGNQPASAVTVTGGMLLGKGTVGPLTVNSGAVVSGGGLGPPPPNGPPTGKPFGGPGVLSVSGPVSLAAGSTLHVDLNGTTAGLFDQINATGSASLGGATLDVSLGYVPAIGDSFPILTCGSLSGTFAGLPEGANLVVGNYCVTVHYGPASVVLTFSSQKLAATAISLAGSASVCGTGSSASVADTGGGLVQHQWCYRTTSGGAATPIPGQTTSAYAINAAHFPAAGTYYLVCLATPTCGTPTYSNEITLSVAAPPTTASVGPGQSICANQTTAALGGNVPSVGTGAWSVVSGGTGTFSSAGDPNATFTETGGPGPITLRWTISNGLCPPSSADVVVTVNQPPSTASVVNGSQSICAGGTTFPLGANTPAVGTGVWSVVSGGTGFFTPSAASATAVFTHTGGSGPVKLRWTISNPPCAPSSADVNVTVSQPPPPPVVSGPQTICPQGTTADLSGGGALRPSVRPASHPAPQNVSGWSVVSGGTGVFNPDSTTFAATFTHTGGAGPITLRWTEPASPPCPSATADIVISLESVPPTVSAPPGVTVAQTTCP